MALTNTNITSSLWSISHQHDNASVNATDKRRAELKCPTRKYPDVKYKYRKVLIWFLSNQQLKIGNQILAQCYFMGLASCQTYDCKYFEGHKDVSKMFQNKIHLGGSGGRGPCPPCLKKQQLRGQTRMCSIK